MCEGRPVKVPVTVIGGFLGAGKTTFLNHLLNLGTERFAVLVNDFGEINIDASLIAKHSGTTLTLANGCICCSMGSSFFETLIRLLEGDMVFDHIVIEASGVGDPWQIAEIALVEDSLVLNGVVVLADAGRIADQLTDPRIGETARRQFAKCDCVLLNKCDVVDESAIERARRAILGSRADPVRIVVTSYETMPSLSSLVMFPNRVGFRAEAISQVNHADQYSDWLYQRRGAFDGVKLDTALKTLPDSLLRLKGQCQINGEPTKSILHLVGKDVSISSCEESSMVLKYEIVLVGVGSADLPSRKALDAILDAALVSESEMDRSHSR